MLLVLSLAACSSQPASNSSSAASSASQPSSSAADNRKSETEPESGTLRIADQGIFSAGGTVISSDGTFDVANYYTSREGSTSHVDHAKELYQLHHYETGLPMVLHHG